MGTNDAFSFITNLIYNNLNNSILTIRTFLDLAKAFDTVNHDILFLKLDRIGIRGTALDLIKDYLADRYQSVRFQDVTSNLTKVTMGVPQGSILGPLLFILYLYLLDMLPDKCIVSYADDTVVFGTAKTWEFARLNMITDLNVIGNWFANNQLSLNTKKTTFLTFGAYITSIPDDIQIHINGEFIERASSVKYLGVIMDCHMRWEEHVKLILRKTRYLLYVFRKLARFMSGNIMLTIYYALFHSITNYGIVAWGGVDNGILKPLDNLRNRLLKIILYGNRNLKKPLDIKSSFKLQSLSTFYSEFKKEYTDINSSTRDKTLVLPKLKINKSLGFKNNYIVALKCFNSLPNVYKSLEVKNKKELKKTLLKSNIFYN